MFRAFWRCASIGALALRMVSVPVAAQVVDGRHRRDRSRCRARRAAARRADHGRGDRAGHGSRPGRSIPADRTGRKAGARRHLPGLAGAANRGRGGSRSDAGAGDPAARPGPGGAGNGDGDRRGHSGCPGARAESTTDGAEHHQRRLRRPDRQFPDTNAVEAVQRIPGISIQRDQGEGRYIIVRGAEPRLNSVMINGERVPSPDAELRQVAADVIPADLLQSIEVSKALTPDMDADAIGGAVNLVMKQAPNEPVMLFTAAGGYNALMDDFAQGQGAFTWGQRLMNRKMGVIVAASTLNTNRGSDNFEAEYDDGDLDTLEIRDYRINREAIGTEFRLRLSAGDPQHVVRARGVQLFQRSGIPSPARERGGGQRARAQPQGSLRVGAHRAALGRRGPSARRGLAARLPRHRLVRGERQARRGHQRLQAGGRRVRAQRQRRRRSIPTTSRPIRSTKTSTRSSSTSRNSTTTSIATAISSVRSTCACPCGPPRRLPAS